MARNPPHHREQIISVPWFFPRRGGNYNNTSNAGLGYVNCNNSRANTNVNYGVRPDLPHRQM